MTENAFQIALAERVPTTEAGYSHLIMLNNEIAACENNEILVDFSKCLYFDANLASVLGAMLDSAKLRGKEIWIILPSAVGVKRCLSRNKFFSAFKVETTSQERQNFIPYEKFSPSQSQEFKKYIDENLIAKQQFPSHTDKAGVFIRECIFEVFANAATHGNCKNIYCCGEYHPNKAIPVLEMTIVDCGKTIVANVNDFLKSKNLPLVTSCHAIHWATRNGNTTKDTPGGLGLWNLIEFIRMNLGFLQIVSGDGMIEFSNGALVMKQLKSPFPGTIVNMAFNFNDNKRYLMSDEIDINNLL